jgi:hypothetical protein
MSLINDALKRAQQVEEPKLPKGPMLRPVEPEEQSPRPRILVPLGLVVVALAAFLVIWKLTSLRADALATTRMPEVRAATPPPNPAPAQMAEAEEDQQIEEPEQDEVVATEMAQQPPPPPAPTVTQQPPVQPAVVRPAPPPISALKLQSIVISKRPSAMISGMFVHVGDSVGELRVKAIRQNQVELAGNGQTIVLTLY